MEKQIRRESSIEEYIEKMVFVFRECRRILKSSGTFWLNIGDSYGGNKNIDSKNLTGMPWKIAFALQADGWILRNDIIWNKPNAMPESVTDRCSKSHEYFFMFTKSHDYFFDHIAIAEKAIYAESDSRFIDGYTVGEKASTGNYSCSKEGVYSSTGLKNKRDVWNINTQSNNEAHFATFPIELITPPILAGCAEKVCSNCGIPMERRYDFQRENGERVPKKIDMGLYYPCDCIGIKAISGIVFDPFMGSGTTAIAALTYSRDYLGVELNPEYIAIAEKRIKNTCGLFS